VYKKEGKVEQGAQPRLKASLLRKLLKIATRAVLMVDHVMFLLLCGV